MSRTSRIVVDVRVEPAGDDRYIVYLLDRPYRHNIALWHLDVHWPLTTTDRREVEWACERLGADARVVVRQIRDAIREAAKRPAQRPTEQRDAPSGGRRFQRRAG